MYHYLIELAFWILLAFFVGCFLGGLARMRFGVAEVVAEVAPVVVPVAAVAAVPKKLKAVAVKAKPKLKPVKRSGKK
jgi:uncharacterized membrane protein YoaK (UPF0700 family)